MGDYGDLVGLDAISKVVLAVIKDGHAHGAYQKDALAEECVRRLNRL